MQLYILRCSAFLVLEMLSLANQSQFLLVTEPSLSCLAAHPVFEKEVHCTLHISLIKLGDSSIDVVLAPNETWSKVCSVCSVSLQQRE